MPTHSGHPYLLGESSKPHTTPMDPQQIAAIFAEINVELDTLKTIDNRLTKVEAMHEPPESPTGDRTPPRNNQHNNTNNTSNPDTQYLKSIKIDVPNFDGRHDSQLFTDWTLQLDRYFTWYKLTESRKVKYAAMRLSGQASQHWTNLENRHAAKVDHKLTHKIG